MRCDGTMRAIVIGDELSLVASKPDRASIY